MIKSILTTLGLILFFLMILLDKIQAKPFQRESQGGLSGKMIHIKTRDSIDANVYEIATAQETNKYVFVLQDCWGLDDFTKRQADRIATDLSSHVTVLAIDLYDGKVADNKDTATIYLQSLSDRRMEVILKSVLAYAGAKAEIVFVGWGQGGSWAMTTALLAGDKNKGCITYYTMPIEDEVKIASLKGPLLGVYATQDKLINKDIIDEFGLKLKAARKKYTFVKYDGNHGFANPINPSYDKNLAEESYQKGLAFMKTCFMLK